ncbi:hypothetical protein A9Q81_22005 [Gammaproteobacteria bacterium 42_54_T18]|nr:hypothetical protein A9Q81_22005 [Gammaproteobacteria bacterium 42_54_T18]
MSDSQGVLPNLISKVLILLGVTLVAVYVVYLPMPDAFQSDSLPGGAFANLGIVLYGLASAGSAFVAWGLIVGHTKNDAITKQQIYKASAVGFALLGFMRLVTAIFPPEQFVEMIFLPIGEFVAFSVIAVVLYRS